MKHRFSRIPILLLSALLLFCCAATDAPASPTADPAETAPEPTRKEGSILLCGELHSDAACISRELELWGDCYAQGMRHLFIETSYFGAQYLNLWMQAEDDEILDRLYRELKNTPAHSEETLRFYHTIKDRCPETVFHGIDIGHQNATTGYRYLEDLKSAGQEGSEAYALAEQAVEQKVEYDYLSLKDESEADAYRERCMTENFIREYDKLNGENIMGIFGRAHTVTADRIESFFAPGTKTMAVLLEEHYGTCIKATDLVLETYIPRESDVVTVNGKEYASVFFGSYQYPEDYGSYSMAFRRLENAYADLRDCPPTGETYRYTDFPVPVEPCQVYLIEVSMPDGSVEMYVFRTDAETVCEDGYFAYLLMPEIRVTDEE